MTDAAACVLSFMLPSLVICVVAARNKSAFLNGKQGCERRIGSDTQSLIAICKNTPHDYCGGILSEHLWRNTSFLRMMPAISNSATIFDSPFWLLIASVSLRFMMVNGCFRSTNFPSILWFPIVRVTPFSPFLAKSPSGKLSTLMVTSRASKIPWSSIMVHSFKPSMLVFINIWRHGDSCASLTGTISF